MSMTELERRCVDAALDARVGALADGPEGHMLAIVRAVLAEAGVAELVEAALDAMSVMREEDVIRDQYPLTTAALHAALARACAR